MSALSYEERDALTEELDAGMSAETAMRFCSDHGHNMMDEEVLDDVLSCAYQCGYRQAERDADPYW